MIAPSPLAPVELGRWVPAEGFDDLGDGTRGAVVGERRIVLRDGMATVVDAHAVDHLGPAHHVASALGGGWLFVGQDSLFFGATFDGPLRPIATGIDANARVGVGADAILVHRAAPAAVEMYKLSTGETIALPVPDTAELFGAPSGQVAVRTAKGALFVSAGRDRSFVAVPTPSPVQNLAYDGKGIVVQFKESQSRVSSAGELLPKAPEPGMTSVDDLFAMKEPWPDTSTSPYAPGSIEKMMEPLAKAMSPRAVLTVDGTDIVVYDGATGRVASKQPNAFAGFENCFVVRGGTPAFVGCGNDDAMNIFRIDAPDKPPVREHTFGHRTYVLDFGLPDDDAALALPKTCDGTALRGAFCVRHDDGSWVDVPPVADPTHILDGVQFFIHTAASPDGIPFAFAWEHGNGDLIVVDGHARAVRRIAKSALDAAPGGGIDWWGLTIPAGTGVLHFLASGRKDETGHKSAGGAFDVGEDGQVHGATIDGQISAQGKRGLVVAPDGKMRETVDGGRTFRDVAGPPGGATTSFMRCVDAGCSVGPWHRLGWGS